MWLDGMSSHGHQTPERDIAQASQMNWHQTIQVLRKRNSNIFAT